MTWFFQGLGFAAVMLIGVAAMGGFSSGSEKLSWQTGAVSTSADIPPHMVPPLRAAGRQSSIEPASKTREIWNLWATAYTAFTHEIAPSKESIDHWWAKQGQELPTREFFESQMKELKAVQAKVAPKRRLFVPAVGTAKRSNQVPASSSATRLVSKVQMADAYADNAGLQEMAEVLNPTIGYWDPLQLANQEFWGQTNEATIGFLREAEIKHGRIAMFGFVGYCVHANGIRWPWAGPWDNIPTDISPQEMWDQLPWVAKAQIILTIAFFEFWRENSAILEQVGEAHYMRGGKPGFFPPLDENIQVEGNQPLKFHPVPLTLYDPFKLFGDRSEEDKARGLIMEINNGRLAMIGLFGFLAESSVEGSVPGLTGLGLKHYDGNVMAPFAADFSFFS